VRGADEFKTSRARGLRSLVTDAEGALWYQLRSRRLNGFKFVRQEPLGPYTVDFICRERRLIVEADGGQHAANKRDKVRDK
jgi:very-short-patch-repair endonuclease